MVDESVRKLEYEYAKEYWGFANIVVGFCVIQTLTFALNLGALNITLRAEIIKNQDTALILAAVATVLYVILVSYFQFLHWRLLKPLSMSGGFALHTRIINSLRILSVAGLGGFAVALICWPQG